MKSILITGANRGLGLGMVKYLAKKKGGIDHIIAATRKPDNEELRQISKENDNVHIMSLDLSYPDKFDEFSKKIEEITGDTGLNVLVNNGGITTKFTTLKYVKTTQLLDGFLINTVAPIMLTKSLLPLIRKASKNNDSKNMSISRAAIINISSILGSITDNDRGGFYPYRCTKAALNAATKSMSIDLKEDGIMVVSIHPGWVKTDMGGKNAPLEIESSITTMFNTLETFRGNHSGNFYQYDGELLQW